MDSVTQLTFQAQPHRNHGLFSDHYLDTILQERADWLALTGEARPIMERITGLIGQFSGGNEAQTEDNIIKPVLSLLGHVFEIQAPLATPHGTKKPDYVFYRGRTAKDALRGRVLDEERLRGVAYAVGDAKHWDRPLDVALRRGGGDNFLNANPSYQIAFYVQHAGVEWGILTNGRLWRLYHRDTAHKLDHYYEVDLYELAMGEDVSRFLFFYGFFRREAFNEGPLGLASLLRGSADYARGVGESLKTQVYEALRHVAQGFLDYRQNGLEADPDTLQEIYDSSLILLYRLLFVLYAEARELLPLNASRDYHDSYSLEAIKRDVAQDLDAGRVLQPHSALLWPRCGEHPASTSRRRAPRAVAEILERLAGRR